MNAAEILTSLSIVATGLMAGVYLAWAISVLPGLALLDDEEYLNAFQQLNRAILNRPFKSLFFAALGLAPLAAILRAHADGVDGLWPLALAAGLLVLGHGGITIFGNIPINVSLDRLNVGAASSAIRTEQRIAFETRWHAWHWARTFATSVAFVLLLADGFTVMGAS